MCQTYRRQARYWFFLRGFNIELLSFDPRKLKRAGDANNPSGGNDAGTTRLCLQGSRDKELYFQSNYAAITVNWGTVALRSIQTLNTGCQAALESDGVGLTFSEMFGEDGHAFVTVSADLWHLQSLLCKDRRVHIPVDIFARQSAPCTLRPPLHHRI